jgi:hypothetical protein
MKLTQPSLSSPSTPVVSAPALAASSELGLVRSGLVAEYRFNEGSGQILYDYSGNNNHGTLGSTTGADTNDPTWTGQGLSHGADDYVTLGGIYNAAGTLQNGYGISIAFYTAEVTAATAKLCLVSFGANKGVYLGAVGEGLTDETITVQYSATSFTYATGTIAAGWHILDLVWNGAQYEIWLDGVQRTGTDVDTPALLSLSAVKMRYDGTTYGSGLTGAYSLKYNRAPTLAERNQNKAYLKSYLLRERGISI